MGQCNFLGQRTKAQAQNLAMGWAGPKTLVFWKNRGRGERRDGINSIFFPVISCFRTSFPVFLYVRSGKIKLNKVMSLMNESMSEKRNFVLFWQFYFGSGTDPSSFVQWIVSPQIPLVCTSLHQRKKIEKEVTQSRAIAPTALHWSELSVLSSIELTTLFCRCFFRILSAHRVDLFWSFPSMIRFIPVDVLLQL